MQRDIKFNNGKLKIMQISDLQDTKRTTVDTLRFIDAALSKVKPDLIILTGDQLDVVGMWNKKNGQKNFENVKKAVTGLFSVFEKHKIPYALTFGNHDGETGVSVEKQAMIYAELESCFCFDNPNDGRPDIGTFNIPVSGADGNTAMNIYLFDCHNTKTDDGYCGPDEKQLEWYKNASEKYGNVPSMVFQHIPPDEIYNLFTQTKKKTKKSQPAYGSRKGQYYALNDDVKCEAYGETPSTLSKSNKEFELMKKQGNVFGIFFGHDHYNSFVGKVDGIDLGYCPGAGYNTYGLEKRAVRVFEFDENDVKNYKTYIVNYRDCCKKSETAPVKNYIYCHAPSCTGAAGAFAVKCTGIILAIVMVLVWISIFINAQFVKSFLIGIFAGSVIYACISFVFNAIMRKKLIKENYNGKRKNTLD